MATKRDEPNDDKPGRVSLLPTVPALPREASSSSDVDDPTPAALGPPEQLGFDLRFEAGRTLLALKDRTVDPGVLVSRALFEVPDVDYPLNVSGGPQQFKNRRLSLRAIELTLSHASLYVPDRLRAAGFTLLRERSRAGGIELLVEMQGPSGGVPIRARGLFAPVGEAGCAIVLHEVISFSPMPRPRAEIAEQLLNALSMPGAQPARAMLRRADPFRAVLARLLPQYGWKVPAVAEVRVHEVVLGKGEITLRAWARELPEGWKAPRDHKRGPLEEAVALAVFADGIVEASAAGAGIAPLVALVDKLLDDVGGATGLAPSVVPFAAEILRSDPRRRAEGQDLLLAALANHEEHLGLLAALAEDEAIDGRERARRLQALGMAADAVDEPWVAARAFLVAAEAALAEGDETLALSCAESAFLADPSVPETGALTSKLLARAGELERALAVGRTALERAEDPSLAEAFAVELAAIARTTEGLDSARVLLRRALRRADRRDALTALIEVEVEAGALERAAELLTRLLVLVEKEAASPVASRNDARADVELLAARLAEARGDRDAARMHLARARELRPKDAGVALRLAVHLDDAGHIDKALEVLHDVTEAPDAADASAFALAAGLLVKRRSIGDAERARALLARVPANQLTPAMARLDAEAQALLGEQAPLARFLVQDAGDAAAGSKQLIEAARLFVDADQIDDAAAALARAFVNDSVGVADLLVQALSSELVRAFGAVRLAGGADLPLTALHAAAARLAGSGRPLDGYALLETRADSLSVELRAAFAESAGEVSLEIEERTRLLGLLTQGSAASSLSGVPKMATGSAQRALAPIYRRLGALHLRPGGGGPGAAADAWEQAATCGSVDVAAWLEAALASNDGARLAAVLRRDDVDVQNVPSAPLRAAIAALRADADAVARLTLAGQLAARGERLDDVETYLAQARALPPEQAARVLADAGARHQRADWLLEAADILERGDMAAAALKLLLEVDIVGGGVASRDLHEKAFSLAVTLGDAVAIERSAGLLLASGHLDRQARLGVHARRTDAIMMLDPAKGRTALGHWLDEDPGSEHAIARFVPDLLKRGELASALDRVEKASLAVDEPHAHGALLALAHQTAQAAQKRGDVAVEIRARELLLALALRVGAGAGAVTTTTTSSSLAPVAGGEALELERLADLYGEAGRVRDAVRALTSVVALGGPDDKLAALYLRMASLQEDQLKDKAAAAQALQGRLRHAPDDASASRHLQSLWAELGDDARLLEECLRRAARLKAGAERTALWLAAGDAALRLDRTKEARAIWLRALRSTPYSTDALDRLLAHGRQSKSHHLVVRARLSAAQTLADGDPAAEQAAEAGAYLYGFMGRPRLALAAFRFAASHDHKPARHLRIIVDLHRALNEGPQALAALDELLGKSKAKDQAIIHEMRAEILEELLNDSAAAAAARRQALALDPTQRTAARSLARALRDSGDARGAFDVDRAWADAALAPPARAAAYASLSARAEDELEDLELCVELCVASLEQLPSIDVRRRHVRALARSGAEAAAVEAIGKLLDEALGLEERLALVLQKARLESDVLGQKKQARQTLKAGLDDAALASHIDADQIVDALVRLEEELDDPGTAAALLLDVLAEHPTGTAALGDRKVVLERAAGLLDDARECERALALLEDAAALDAVGLSRAGELRRARLAEELGQPAIAVISLQHLLGGSAGPAVGASSGRGVSGDAEERVALLGRLAVAAERQGDDDLAFSSWRQRAERTPGDGDTLRHLERLAAKLGRAEAGRAASDALLRLDEAASPGDGGSSDDERFARLLACARDSRDRLGDPAAAAALLDRARVIRTDASLRRESFACAEAAGDPSAALALLDEMGVRDDPLDAALLLRRAALRVGADGEMAIAFADLARALDLGGLALADAAATVAVLVEAAAAADVTLVARALLDRAGDGGATVAALRTVFTPERLAHAALPAELVTGIANALPLDVDFAVAAAERARAVGQGAAAADRLWALADRLERAERRAADQGELTAGLASAGASLLPVGTAARARDELRDRGAEALLSSATTGTATGPGDQDIVARLDKLRPSLVRKPELRGEALLVLRDAEAWGAVASVLEDAVFGLGASSGAATKALPTEARALRLELVSVLRTGLEDEARAAAHLQALVEEDPDDREAWGELLECLDALGTAPEHRARLADALGVRASLAAGIEKRELVRRRSLLLLELGRGEDALPQLVQVRVELIAAGGADAELKLLERRVHEARGPAELATFLAAELQRSLPVPGASWGGNDAGRFDAARLDAEGLLALDPAVAAPAARVHAHLVLAVDESSAGARARALLDGAPAPDVGPAAVKRLIDEAVAVAEALGEGLGGGAGAKIADGLRRAFLAALAERSGVLGGAGALALSDALFATGVEGTAQAFGAAPARRRWRLEGPRRVAIDLERLALSGPPGSDGDAARATVAAIALRRAARIGDDGAARAAAAALPATAGAAIREVLDARVSVGARGELAARAARAVAAQARSSAALVAAVRVGDVARGQASIAHLPGDARTLGARRARHLKLTPDRLTLRLALAPSLAGTDATLELAAAVGTALRAQRWPDAAVGLDGLIERGAADAGMLSERADVAWHLNSADAPQWSTRAADALTADALRIAQDAGRATMPASNADATDDGLGASETTSSTVRLGGAGGPEALRHRRKAVEGLLRAASGERAGAPDAHDAATDAGQAALEAERHAALGRALTAFARAAPDDPTIQAEALGIAEAAGLHDVIDALMGEVANRSASAADRGMAYRRRAAHRLEAQKDALGAFAILRQGAHGGDTTLREAAYQLAAAEGLVEAQLEVVDDDLARAALLALLGKSEAASSAARSIDSPAAWLLVAEIAALEGDIAGEALALERLSASGALDAVTLALLVGLDRRRGKLEDAAVRAADLVARFGPSAQRLALLLEVAGGGAGAAQTAPVLRSLLEADPPVIVPALRDKAVDVWEASALLAGLPQDVRAARLRRCRWRDEDALWLSFLVIELPRVSVDEAALWLRPLLSRKTILRRLVEAEPQGLSAALGLLVRTGDAAAVAEALGAVAPIGLSAALLSELASALAVLGRPVDAARALLQAPPRRGSAGQTAARAAGLFAEGEDVRGAVDALLAAPLSEMDEGVISMAREVAKSAGGEGVPLLVRVALATADAVDVDAVLALAEQASPDVALAVAGWYLNNAPLDVRAWRLVAARGAGAAQQHFAVALALRGLAPWPADLVDDGARARRLRQGTLALHVARAWAEARRPRTALQHARLGMEQASRRLAWRELAAAAGASGDDVGAARLLARAGVAMSAAPIEVRLAADPLLADPLPRAAAIADALGAPELAGAVARRAPLVAAFDALDERGFAGARLRQDVHGARSGIVGQIDGNDLGAGVDPRAVLQLLGRRPSPSLRATAAALLGAAGHEDLAGRVDPRAARAQPVRPSWQTLEARALGAASAGRSLEAAGLLRLVAAAVGYSADRERMIQGLAEKAGRLDLAAESLGRMAGHATAAKERAALLRERALLLAGQPDDPRMMQRASANARAASALLPDDVDSARLWLQLAQMRPEADGSPEPAHDLARDLAAALGAVARTTPKASERAECAAARVRLLVDKLGDSSGALLAVEESLLGMPGDKALLQERARTLSALGRHEDAGRAFQQAAAAAQEQLLRKDLRRAAAQAFLAAGRPDDAVEALLASIAEGDLAALAVAEPIARDLAGPRALDAVLELQLKDTREQQKRRVLTLERARLLADKLDDREGATLLLEQQAVEDDGDLGARLALAEWYLLDRRVLDAALAYESAASIPGLPPLSAGAPAREAACILASLGDLERAGPLAQSAVNAGVVDHRVLAVAEAWHRAHGRHAEVDGLLGREIDLEADVRMQATMWMERAELRRDMLNDAAAARKAVHRVLELVPDHEGALAVMRVEGARDGAWGPLRAALFRAVDFTPARSVQIARLQEIASLDAEHFNDLRAAEATIDRALAIDADNAQSLVLKARFLVRAGQIDGVPALIARAEQSGAVELPGLLQLVRGDGLLLSDDREGARAAFRKAAADPETAVKAWDRLIDLAEGSPVFAATLEDARAHAEDPRRQASLLKREARARHKAGDEDGHIRCLELLLGLEPGDSDALKIVREAYTRRRKLQPILPLLAAWARAVPGAGAQANPQERGRRLGELGAFILDELGNEQLARDTFEEALGADGDETTSLLKLADIAWAARDDERALELLDRIQPAQWPSDPVELVYRRARCAYALGRDDAQQRLRAVLRLDVKHQDALDMLVKLAVAKHDDELAEFALESLAAAISPREDPVRLAEACVELASLRGRQGRWQDALVAVERAFELDAANARVLESLATVRQEAGKHLEAAEAWRRLSVTKAGASRVKAIAHRAENLYRGGRYGEAVDLLVELRRETGEPKYREEAEAWARQSGDVNVMRRLGIAPPLAADAQSVISITPEVTRTQTMGASSGSDSNRAVQRGFNALHLQVRANLEENDPVTALRIVEEAVTSGAADLELLQLGVDAAEQANAPHRLVDIVEARLKGATDPEEVKLLARLAGKIARERLSDLDRAATLLYLAHQADAEDVEVRLELTQIYAQIPRLASHAVTGILQLLRRTPADPRVFTLAAELAESQQTPERARAMRTIESVLRGKGMAADKQAILDERPAIRALDAESIQSRLAPTGWGSPLQQLLAVLGSAVETVLAEPAVPGGLVALHDQSPRGALAIDRLERALPGRPFRILCGAVDQLLVLPGAVPTVVVPEDVLGLGDAALLAAVARAYGLVRLGAVLPEVLKPGEDQALIDILRTALVEEKRDARANKLRGRLRDDELAAARALAVTVFAGPVDLAGTLGILSRAADRFALVVSGSIAGTLHAGALPTLLREPPQRAAALLANSPRALELAAFAARDNAWLVRRQHGFSQT